MWSVRPGLTEYLFCEVVSSNAPPVFAEVVYRHLTPEKYTDFFPELVNHLHNYSTNVIMRDFNADPRSNQSDADFFRNHVSKNSFHSILLSATYHRKHVDSELDSCLVDANDVVIDL